jgi:hypothetical protein
METLPLVKRPGLVPILLLDGTGGLTIGDYCNISAGVQIYTHDTIDWVLSRGKAKYAYAPVKIGDCCHVGSQSGNRQGCDHRRAQRRRRLLIREP